MKLIRSIRVERFRSIRDTALDHLGDFSVIAGVNNSGKSNLLRALCLYFTGTCRDGSGPVDLPRDYYLPDARSKQRKRIRVTVSFDLPESFRFRQGLEEARDLVGARPTITREWDREGERTYLDEAELTNPNDRLRVAQFLSLVSFRYVPNRVLPLDVIREEHQALRDVIVRRLSRRRQESVSLLNSIDETSQRAVRTISDQVRALGVGVDSVELSSPQCLADLVFGMGYRLKEGGFDTADSLQGSGLQSFLMLQTLHLIDQDYFQRFGWKQAAIWAVEEPESSMHALLEAQAASWLSQVSKSTSGRLQVLATSHSDLMVQYADAGYYVERQTVAAEKEATVARHMGARDLLLTAARTGATRFIDPILMHPLDPILLVEGKSDRDLLRSAYGLLGKDTFRVCCLEDLTDSATGGDELRPYIKHHADAIKSRPPDAPVVLLLDWDKKSKVKAYQRLVSAEHGLIVRAWPDDQANPSLDRSFRGVERFYSDRLVEAAEQQTDAIARNRRGIAMVQKDRYGEVKAILADLSADGLQARDLVYAKRFLLSLLEAVPV